MTDQTGHPALSPGDIQTAAGSILDAAADRTATGTELDRLTAYIDYLTRMGCEDGCGRRVAHVDSAGRLRCWPCAEGPRIGHDIARFVRAWHRIAEAAERTYPDEPDPTTALMCDVITILGENPRLIESERVGLIAAAAGLAAGTESSPEPVDDDTDPYPDAIAGLAEAAAWAARWAHEHDRARGEAAALARVDELHHPYTDADGRTRCRGCIAGYDPRTGELTNCAWPCPTKRARDGDIPWRP